MATNTSIEWCDSTYNPWIGCTNVSPGCDNCYAEATWADRLKHVVWGGERKPTSAGNRRGILRLESQADAFMAEHGRRRRVFCASLADVFDNHKSIKPEWRAELAETIRLTPSLDWLLLTKRIGNALHYLLEMFPFGVPHNVRVGATIVNQLEWERDCRKVAAVRVACVQKPFLSLEPLLGPIDFASVDPAWKRYVGWVIAGGESGRDARPMNPSWLRGVRDQCARDQMPFLFKQWGEWAPGSNFPEHTPIPSGNSYQWSEGDDDNAAVWRVGKKNAGRTLDGRLHTEFPA